MSVKIFITPSSASCIPDYQNILQKKNKSSEIGMFFVNKDIEYQEISFLCYILYDRLHNKTEISLFP